MRTHNKLMWKVLISTTCFTMVLLVTNLILLFVLDVVLPDWFIALQILTLLSTPSLVVLMFSHERLRSQLFTIARHIEAIAPVKEYTPIPNEASKNVNAQTIEAHLVQLKDHIAEQTKRLSTLEERLKTEKYLFATLMDNIPDYIYFKDRQCKLIRLSKHMARLFNMREEEMIGKSDFDFHDEAHAKEAYDDEQKIMETRHPKIGYLEREVRADGTEVWVSTTKMPLLNTSDEVVGTFGISRDVSDVKRLEKEMLERTEQERFAKMEALKLREEAIQASLAKSTFLATMSHEIRTPLNGVIGMASLLLETNLNKEQSEYAETIRSCGDSLLSVINNILDFSKIESGKMELDIQDLDLRACIEEVLDIFAAKAAETKIDLLYQMSHNVPSIILCDGLRLKQVLMNLVGNAIKFTRQGEIFIGVDVKKAHRKQMELAFEIRDTGIGIPEDKLDRLFKAFSQVDSSTTRKYGGSGLGLVICEKLVALMGGAITVESRPGQGTTFTFTILAEASVSSVVNYVHFNSEGLHGKKILVVDDNETNRQLLKTQLEQWNFSPILADSPKEGIRILSGAQQFDLVITDMQMPNIDGVGFAKLIKKTHPNLPIILLSSVGDEQRKHYEHLFSYILTKPVKQKILSSAITAELRKQGKSKKPESIPDKKLSTDFAQKYPLTILIAEDNAVNQKLAIRALKKLGYEPSVAENGRLTIEEFARTFYDVILMDVQMPEMDGLDATRQIRKRGQRQPVIIAMTANAMAGDKEVCLQAGMDDYISKPINLDEMINVLEKWAIVILNNNKSST